MCPAIRDQLDSKPTQPMGYVVPQALIGPLDPLVFDRHKAAIQRALQNVDYSVIAGAAEDFVRCLHQGFDVNTRQIQVNIAGKVQRVVLDVLIKVIFGYSSFVQVKENSLLVSLRQLLAKISPLASLRSRMGQSSWEKLPSKQMFDQDVQQLHELMLIIMESRDVNLKSSVLNNLESFIDEESKETLSPAEIRDECLSLLLSGHETTSNVISWTMYFLSLSQNNTALEKVINELDRLLFKKRRPDSSDLNQMKYLWAAALESMRNVPVVPIFTRKTTKSVAIGDLEILPESTVHIQTSQLKQKDKMFSSFNLERCLEGESFDLFPFGVGSHHCIGKDIAKMVILSVLASLLREFSVSEVVGFLPDPKYSVTVQSGNGIKVNLTRRR
jgi:cytochrome P450